MGKGKGAVDYWVCPVRKGTLLYEIGGVSKETALQALHGGSTKLPVATKIIF
jgi:large subunit ribosomal protein L16